jgi:hypothetical protein
MIQGLYCEFNLWKEFKVAPAPDVLPLGSLSIDNTVTVKKDVSDVIQRWCVGFHD